MADIEYGPISDPFANIRDFGLDQPTIATPEQNDRVRLIAEAFKQGKRPSDLGVSHAEDVQFMPDTSRSSSSSMDPLGDAMRRDPKSTVAALQAAYANIKGLPPAVQTRVMSEYLDPKLESLMVTHTPAGPESTVKANPVTGKTDASGNPSIQAVPEPSPQDSERHAKIMEILTKRNYTKAGAEAMANSAVPSVRQWNLYQDQLKKNQEKVATWLASPAPTNTIYLDKEGKPYNPTLNQDRVEGGVSYGLNTPQGKLVQSVPLLLSHVLQTANEVDKIAPKGKNAFQNWLKAKQNEWQGNSAQRVLGDLLDPASSMAVGTLYASGGAQTRGGARLAEMFHNSFYTPGDNIQNVKEKLSTSLGLMHDILERQNVHPKYLHDLEVAQQRVNSMGGKATDSLVKGTTKFDTLPDPKVYVNKPPMYNPETGELKAAVINPATGQAQWIDMKNIKGDY